MPEQKSEVYLYNDLPDTINALLDFDERMNRKRFSFLFAVTISLSEKENEV